GTSAAVVRQHLWRRENNLVRESALHTANTDGDDDVDPGGGVRARERREWLGVLEREGNEKKWELQHRAVG
ncbi:hypothetical protein PIB30_033009, partial [Stylosanthes scabra]|nr:hypothetical protein [Stylosanthes scabra]